MKKKLISVLALVLFVCFVWVAEVDAAELVYNSVGDFYSIFKNCYIQTYNYKSSYQGEANCNFVTLDANYNGDLYSFPCLYNSYFPVTYGVGGAFFRYLFFDANQGDTCSFKLYLIPLTYYSQGIVSGDFESVYRDFEVHLGYYSISSTDEDAYDSSVSFSRDVIDLTIAGVTNTYDVIVIDVNHTFTDYNMLTLSFYTMSSYSESRENMLMFGLGMLTPYVATGLSDEEKELLQLIYLGVNDANIQLDQMQSEQSSYYQDILESDASDTGVISEASSQKDKFDGVMSEYSSLNEALDRPDVNELLPDYSSVVGGYKDDEFYDVFDVFYGNGYIMFMLLASVFFATMSFVIFGKKA